MTANQIYRQYTSEGGQLPFRDWIEANKDQLSALGLTLNDEGLPDKVSVNGAVVGTLFLLSAIAIIIYAANQK